MQRPQLAYALFQAMLLMNIVDPSVLQRIQPLPPSAPPAAVPAPAYPAYPPQQPAQPAGYGGYPPPGAAQPPFRPQQPPAAYSAPRPPAPAPQQPAYGGYQAAPAPAPSGIAALPPATQAALAGLPEDQKVGPAQNVHSLTIGHARPGPPAHPRADQRPGSRAAGLRQATGKLTPYTAADPTSAPSSSAHEIHRECSFCIRAWYREL